MAEAGILRGWCLLSGKPNCHPTGHQHRTRDHGLEPSAAPEPHRRVAVSCYGVSTQNTLLNEGPAQRGAAPGLPRLSKLGGSATAGARRVPRQKQHTEAFTAGPGGQPGGAAKSTCWEAELLRDASGSGEALGTAGSGAPHSGHSPRQGLTWETRSPYRSVVAALQVLLLRQDKAGQREAAGHHIQPCEGVQVEITSP